MKIIKWRSFTIYPIAVGFLLLLSACANVPKNDTPPLQVVPHVDIDRYLGKWYEIARYPHALEKGCFQSTAFYQKMPDGMIQVVNQCRMDSPEGALKQIVGTVASTDSSGNAKLKVQFLWPFWGNYWIVHLDSDYQYAVVSEPNRQYLWILSRSPQMDAATLNEIKEALTQKNFDMSRLLAQE
ncbi:MAG: lipocalin family protein [Candidatus Nitrohelix vancouverensis]|uniref:Lipocalin family protein n=1 Tax=Candidatus Nitrohelix vancouverensis TaxID=2705534 RepID=A0A7T0C1J7_9BACT|nr:MAG: lipocalin family protein [Candidatus Nitrohelix vancouverensis]